VVVVVVVVLIIMHNDDDDFVVVVVKSDEMACPIPPNEINSKNYTKNGRKSGLVVSYSTHDWKVVGSNLIQYYNSWKWCQSHARFDSCTQSCDIHSIIEKKRKYR